MIGGSNIQQRELEQTRELIAILLSFCGPLTAFVHGFRFVRFCTEQFGFAVWLHGGRRFRSGNW